MPLLLRPVLVLRLQRPQARLLLVLLRLALHQTPLGSMWPGLLQVARTPPLLLLGLPQAPLVVLARPLAR